MGELAISLQHRLLHHFVAYYVSAAIIVVTAIFKFVKLVFSIVRFAIRSGAEDIKVYGEREHEENVVKVQKQVKEWNENGRKTRMCTGRPGWKTICNRTPIYKDTLTKIDINMNNMIYIKTGDATENVVCVEPLMTMGELTQQLEHRGWTLPVVPELDVLTIGGLVCGAGLETSSHKYGLFHNICVGFEVVLASGDVVKCTEKQNSDLFYAITGSHGTLGFLTAIELKIIPAKTHVRLEYIPVHSLDDAISMFEEQTYQNDGNEFVEGIMFSLDKGVIMVGDMVSAPPNGKVNEIGKWYKPWFYKHVETFLNTNINAEYRVEYIPLRDYYHRHTKCLFWVNANFIPYGNNCLFRYLLGWTLPPRIDFVKLLAPKAVIEIFDANHLVQDFVIPIETLKEALLLTHRVMQVYPIWLCPAKMKNIPGACHFRGDGDEMYVDVGIYGISKVEDYDIVKSARKLELFCLENRGYQALYSDVFMTREEFGKMFKEDLYMKMRKELNCEDAFPEVYEKVCRASRR